MPALLTAHQAESLPVGFEEESWAPIFCSTTPTAAWGIVVAGAGKRERPPIAACCSSDRDPSPSATVCFIEAWYIAGESGSFGQPSAGANFGKRVVTTNSAVA